MSTLPTDAFPDFSDSQLPDSQEEELFHAAPNPSIERAIDSSGSSPFYVRAARQQDLTNLAEVLTSSFHSSTGTMGWLYPLLRQGIYEDMRMRMRLSQGGTAKRSTQAHYACLVAVRRMSSQEAVFESRASESPQLAVAGSDRLVGTVEISLKTGSPFLRQSPYLYLSNLAVLAEYRQQGVAQQLLRVCERVALDWGYQDLYLHVLEDNARAQRLYSKAGYEVERIDTTLTSVLLGRSRQMFLHKSIPRT
ncbi:GNAT family N-acetyltransferase [Leptolyngbya sp. GB1-A1]|uniref:GNAT family N-acetyltransferase n=1 Tax=Leptolyngbya sp. GB1-A1 TaxID=2933908 RepID=UPI003297B7A9